MQYCREETKKKGAHMCDVATPIKDIKKDILFNSKNDVKLFTSSFHYKQ